MNKEAVEMFIRDAAQISGTSVVQGEPMSRHTTIGVGGRAALFARPGSPEEVAALAGLAGERNIEYLVIGKGSNLLVRDGGYVGLVIKLAKKLSAVRFGETTVTAEAGAMFSSLGRNRAAARGCQRPIQL